MSASIHLLAAVLQLVSASACGQASPEVPASSGPVGFRVERLSDAERSFAASRRIETVPRPIQVYIWYPAADSCANTMTWGEVVGWLGVESSHAPLDTARAEAGRNEFVAWMASLGADTTAARASLAFPLRACAGAIPDPRRHPLVLLAVGRDDSPVMHAVLAEALASRGWVVLSSPGLGARERPMTFEAADIEAQVEDLETLASHADALDFVDPSRPAILGFSYGGGSAILYAMANTTVAAVVSLDGSIGFADRVASYVETPEWRPDRARAPVLHLRAPDEERKDLTALGSLLSPARVMTIQGATHYDFTTLGPVSATGLAIPPLGLDDSNGDELHAEIVSAILAFLEEHRPPAGE